jgi:leader peptidase (prepilin peptidase)/N-methyltransferase
VVIHRVPQGQSVVHPPSACPNCQTAIRPRDNVPLAGWLLLKGKCRNCRHPISPATRSSRQPQAGLFAVMALRFGLDWVLPAYLYLAAVGPGAGADRPRLQAAARTR